MSMFGWSLPPGCTTVPGEQFSAIDLTHLLTETERQKILGLFWDEDGNLIESFVVDVPADQENGIPAYTECQSAWVGVHDWSDELSEQDNCQRAIAAWRIINVG